MKTGLQKGQTAMRRFFLRLLCVPFLLAQLIAPGTMATAGPAGLQMVLCTGEGNVTVVLTEDGEFVPVEDDTGHHPSDAVCPWTAAFGQAALDTVPMALQTPMAMARPLSVATATDVPAAAFVHCPHARAPPVTV